MAEARARAAEGAARGAAAKVLICGEAWDLAPAVDFDMVLATASGSDHLLPVAAAAGAVAVSRRSSRC